MIAAVNAFQCTDICVQQCQDSSNQDWKVQLCIQDGCNCSTNDMIPDVVPMNAVDISVPFVDVSVPTNNIPHLQCTDWCVGSCQDSSNQEWKVQLCIQKACSCNTNDMIPSIPSVPMNGVGTTEHIPRTNDMIPSIPSVPMNGPHIMKHIPRNDWPSIPTNSDCEDQCQASSNQDFKVQACIKALCNSVDASVPFVDVSVPTNSDCEDQCTASSNQVVK